MAGHHAGRFQDGLIMSIIFFDIDNTLLSHKTFTIPDSALKALRMAKERGHRSFISSGRAYDSLKEYLDPELFDGAIGGSGACGFVNGEPVFTHFFDNADVLRVYEIAQKAGAGMSVQSIRTSRMTEYGMDHFRKYAHAGAERIRKMNFTVFDPATAGQCCKMDLFFGPEVDYMHVISQLPDTIDQCPSLSVTSEMKGCELTPRGVNKAAGAMELAKYLNIDVQDSYAFGDSENDIEIIRACGTGIAMGNGAQKVKEAADYVTADIEEDGIWLAMKHFNLI